MKLDDFLKTQKVRCIIGSSSSCNSCLTAGKLYDVIGATHGRLKIHNDNGGNSWYDFEKFELVIEPAENPLQGVELTPEFEALPDELKPSQTPITYFSFIDVLKKSAQSILTQDNAATANPAYCVKDKKRAYGFDGTTTNDYVWYSRDDDSEYDNTDDMYKALDTIADEINEDEIVLNGNTYERSYYELEESTVTTCFTREQAQRYIDENRHNLKNPFIYVESFNRNPEMIAVRELLICLAENPTMFDGVLVNA